MGRGPSAWSAREQHGAAAEALRTGRPRGGLHGARIERDERGEGGEDGEGDEGGEDEGPMSDGDLMQGLGATVGTDLGSGARRL